MFDIMQNLVIYYFNLFKVIGYSNNLPEFKFGNIYFLFIKIFWLL